jgi:hypothetical protein
MAQTLVAGSCGSWSMTRTVTDRIRVASGPSVVMTLVRAYERNAGEKSIQPVRTLTGNGCCVLFIAYQSLRESVGNTGASRLRAIGPKYAPNLPRAFKM